MARTISVIKKVVQYRTVYYRSYLFTPSTDKWIARDCLCVRACVFVRVYDTSSVRRPWCLSDEYSCQFLKLWLYCRILEKHCCYGSHLPSLRVVKTVRMDSSPRLASAEECSEYTKYHSRQQTSSDCFILLLQQVGRGKDPYDINHQPASGYAV